MKATTRNLGALALAALLAAPVASAEGRARLSDTQVRAVVEHGLLSQDIGGVSVAVEGGKVTLTGMVQSAWSRERAEAIAQGLREVTGVDNRLTVARAENDAILADVVAEKLRRSVLYTVFDDVEVGVKDGTVTLLGDVTLGYKAGEMARVASKVAGVQAVRNEIQTLPTSIADDQVRVAVASRIYGDPLFEPYALKVPPPIHIVVRGGRVTLTGAVGSEVEKAKAGFAAREVFGVMGVDNRLRVAP